MDRRRVVSFHRRAMVSLNRREVVNLTGACSLMDKVKFVMKSSEVGRMLETIMKDKRHCKRRMVGKLPTILLHCLPILRSTCVYFFIHIRVTQKKVGACASP